MMTCELVFTKLASETVIDLHEFLPPLTTFYSPPIQLLTVHCPYRIPMLKWLEDIRK
jgi:hypothetical protein